MRVVADAMSEALYGDNAQPMMGTQAPGHGEIVGGVLSRKADEIAKLARKKGGVDEIQRELGHLTATATYEGRVAAERMHSANIKAIHEAHTDKVVNAALATLMTDPRFRDGFPGAVTISGYTLARIVDALNRAGYHGDLK